MYNNNSEPFYRTWADTVLMDYCTVAVILGGSPCAIILDQSVYGFKRTLSPSLIEDTPAQNAASKR